MGMPTHMVDFIGFGDENAPRRQCIGGRASIAGRDQKGDMRPESANVMGKRQAVHGTRHMHIGEKERDDIGVSLKTTKRFRGMSRLDHPKTVMGEKISRQHPDQSIVLGNQDGLWRGSHGQ